MTKHFTSPSGQNSQRWRVRHTGLPTAAAVAAFILLCGFTKPLTPITSYRGIPYAKLINVYQHAYGHMGMTKVEIASEPAVKLSDGTRSTFESFTFSYPSRAKHRKVGGTEFGVSALTKNGICIKCDITRTTYWSDSPDKKATDEIKHALGKSVPFEPGSP